MVLCFNDGGQKQYFARVYDQATGQALTPPLKHEGTVIHALFSPDGQRVLTFSDDKTARLWDAATGKPSPRPSSMIAGCLMRRSARTAARGHRQL